MKNAIREYIELSDEEKKSLWDSATFVFDTNVFLNLYRYSTKLREELLEAIESLQTRIWIPYQVAYELANNRYDVINETNKRFDKCQGEIEPLVSSWMDKLRLDEEDAEINALRKYLTEWLENKKNLFVSFDYIDDPVFKKLMELFEGKTGKSFSDDDKEKIKKEGTDRYSKKIPPGFKDSKKDDNQFGDLFIWKEILNYAEEKKVDIVFITQDRKEDWWNIRGGKTIGPRPELRREFYKKTNQKFHMYTMTNFLAHYYENKGASIDKSTIDEIEQVDKENVEESISLGRLYMSKLLERIGGFRLNRPISVDLLEQKSQGLNSLYSTINDLQTHIRELEEKETENELSKEEKERLAVYKEDLKECEQKLNEQLKHLMQSSYFRVLVSDAIGEEFVRKYID